MFYRVNAAAFPSPLPSVVKRHWAKPTAQRQKFIQTPFVPLNLYTQDPLFKRAAMQWGFANFTVSNIGTDMTTSTNYIVVEDIIIMTPPPPQIITLPQDGTEVLTFPANGKTYRLEVEQPQGHPWSTFASATVGRSRHQCKRFFFNGCGLVPNQ